ncbi:MAG TPA: M48 family metallopeptidase [Burkholderiaceae bacterium]|nr:M48 family metallopeptidase [Burkholderiaceae bacterium]HMX09948.1 M48 family metallopeptidase [Burkholderiaceae bacterium]HMY99043.1 M48 family metallopeptidase [Burkholderiaceae bacterium]HNB43238.1 M48 family metallopeptidase [Burkholderiaceae bacterium]HNG78757.1 M48 family metallopeptidase [Burkholderiaceae bacterium]
MTSLTVTVVFATALLLMLALRLWLIGRQVRHVARYRAAVPTAFAGTVSLEAHQKAADYTVARQRLDLIATAWSAAVLLGWTLLGGLDALNIALRDALLPRWGGMGYQLALLTAVSLIGGLIDLPLDVWRTFRLEQRFGFNRMTPGLWLRDLIVGALLGAVIGLPLAALLLWLMAAAGALWWLWAFAVLAGFTLLMQVLYPTVIAPLFNKFQPLADQALADRVTALMQRCGFRAQGFYVMDGSKRSAHANAYFTGFGGSKRVVFFDTLLSRLSPAQVEAVLAHELGHFHHRHVPKRLASVMGVWLLSLALLGWLMNQAAFYTGLGVQPNLFAPNDALALLLVVMVGPVFGFFISPLTAALSRRQEFEADAFACRQADASELKAALLKLYEDNASTLTPDPLYVRAYYSHPPAGERLSAMQASPATASAAA